MPTLLSHATAAGLSTATTGAINTTGASLIVIGIARQASNADAISDSAGNTWTKLTESLATGAVGTVMYYCAAPNTSATHTFTLGSTNAGVICVAAFSGIQTVTPFDQQNGGSNTTGSTLATGSVTPTQNGELLVTMFGFNVAGTPVSINSGFTITDTTNFASGVNYGGSLAYFIQTTAGAINPTWTRTGSSSQAARIATFIAAAAAAGGMSVNMRPKLGSSIKPHAFQPSRAR